MSMTDMRDVKRPALTGSRKVMIGGFAVIAALTLVVVQAVLYRGIDPVAIVIGVVALAAAGMVATGARWAVVVATVLAALLLLFDGPIFVQRFGHPDELGLFLVSLTGLACYVAIVVAGIRTLLVERPER